MATRFPLIPLAGLVAFLAGACSEPAVTSPPTSTPVSAIPRAIPDSVVPRGYHLYLADRTGALLRWLAPGHAVTWSPDGTRIAFQSPDGVSRPGMYAVEVLDGTARWLAGPHASSPRWSPDGSRIAFITWVANDQAGPFPMYDTEFRVIDADGSTERALTRTTHLGTIRPPEWSPDGKRLAIIRGDHRGADLHVMDADGGGLTRVTQLGDVTAAQWSPDGAAIALAAGGSLYVVRPDGSGLDRLTSGVDSRIVCDVAWSPRGSRIAIAICPDPRLPGEPAPESFTIDVIAVDGGGRTTLATRATRPRWLPDGQYISYDRHTVDETWIAPVDGGQHSFLLPGFGAAWSPHGNRVAYIRHLK